MRVQVHFLLFALFVVGCASEADPTDAVLLEDGPGEFTNDFETSANFTTRMDAPVVGSSPHGEVQIWYSANLEPVLDSAAIAAPRGTVSIKTSNSDGTPGVDALAVMIKQPAGYDRENGDWLYEMRSPDGAVMTDPESGMPMSGRIEMCIQCHRGYRETDYLAGISLR